jgi:hypothetical protein
MTEIHRSTEDGRMIAWRRQNDPNSLMQRNIVSILRHLILDNARQPEGAALVLQDVTQNGSKRN